MPGSDVQELQRLHALQHIGSRLHNIEKLLYVLASAQVIQVSQGSGPHPKLDQLLQEVGKELKIRN